MTAIVRAPAGALTAELAEQVLLQGDLAKLTPAQRVQYYLARCEACGLDPRTKPFEYIVLNGKLTLYATAVAAYQAAASAGISLSVRSREEVAGLFIVTVRAFAKDGRYTETQGAVASDGLKGEARANALMKAETKAKRRAVIQLTGMGMLDETETETISSAVQIRVDPRTGEILESVPALPAGNGTPSPNMSSARNRVLKLCEQMGWTKPYLARFRDILGDQKIAMTAITDGQMMDIEQSIQETLKHKRGAFRAWSELCALAGDQTEKAAGLTDEDRARLRSLRLQTWTVFLDLDRELPSSTELSAAEWTALHDKLARAAREYEIPGDPFQNA